MTQGLQHIKVQQAAETQHTLEVELENSRQTGVGGRKKTSKISLTNKSAASPSNNNPMSSTDVKTKNTGLRRVSRSQKTLLKTETKLNYVAFNINSVFVSTDSNLNVVADLGELSFRAVSPALSNRRGSQCSQVKMKISNIPCFTVHFLLLILII